MHRKETDQEIQTPYFKKSLAAILKFLTGQVEDLTPNQSSIRGKSWWNAHLHIWAIAHMGPQPDDYGILCRGCFPCKPLFEKEGKTALPRAVLCNFGCMRKEAALGLQTKRQSWAVGEISTSFFFFLVNVRAEWCSITMEEWIRDKDTHDDVRVQKLKTFKRKKFIVILQPSKLSAYSSIISFWNVMWKLSVFSTNQIS